MGSVGLRTTLAKSTTTTEAALEESVLVLCFHLAMLHFTYTLDKQMVDFPSYILSYSKRNRSYARTSIVSLFPPIGIVVSFEHVLNGFLNAWRCLSVWAW